MLVLKLNHDSERGPWWKYRFSGGFYICKIDIKDHFVAFVFVYKYIFRCYLVIKYEYIYRPIDIE